MKPYGMEYRWKSDRLNSSKHRPCLSSATRQLARRLAKKTRRAIDKALLRQECEA